MVLENSRNKTVLKLQHKPDNLDVNRTCFANKRGTLKLTQQKVSDYTRNEKIFVLERKKERSTIAA